VSRGLASVRGAIRGNDSGVTSTPSARVILCRVPFVGVGRGGVDPRATLKRLTRVPKRIAKGPWRSDGIDEGLARDVRPPPPAAYINVLIGDNRG